MAGVGIDFGTTNSIIVAYEKSKNEFYYFNIADTPVPMPSTVWYHDGRVVVGQNAKNSLFTYSGIEGHHFERSIKLRLGD